MRKYSQTCINKFINSVDPDEAAHDELPHLGQHCLSSFFEFKITGISFAGVNFVVCFLGALKVKGKQKLA